MKRTFFVTCLMIFTTLLFAQQDKGELERERQEIQKEIRELQSVYNKIKGEKNVSLGQANVVKRKLDLQEKYLNNINREIRTINDDIYLSTLEINKMKRQLDTLKEQYARSVVYAYKNRSTYDHLNFIFSASSFNDALKRVSYMRSYRNYRQQQVSNILEHQQKITLKMSDQVAKKEQKNVALQSQTKQIRVLEEEKKEKDAVVTKLKSQEKQLQKQIGDKRKKDKQLQGAIAAIVRREIEEARKEAARKAEEERKKNATATTTGTPTGTAKTTTTKPAATTPSKPKSYLDLNEKDVALNSSFEKNKGKLPWPVDNAYVSMGFGSNKIENTGLTFDNPGITLATPSGMTVKSVFDGEVVAVFNLGDGMAVTIRHGKYFTTYSNLSSVSVSKGTAIKTGQSIGKAGAAESGDGGQIDFILMIEAKNVNPTPWLRR